MEVLKGPKRVEGTLVSPFFFVNDSLLFGQATTLECKITEILNSYEASLGQKINKEKMTLFFCSNTRIATLLTI